MDSNRVTRPHDARSEESSRASKKAILEKPRVERMKYQGRGGEWRGGIESEKGKKSVTTAENFILRRMRE